LHDLDGHGPGLNLDRDGLFPPDPRADRDNRPRDTAKRSDDRAQQSQRLEHDPIRGEYGADQARRDEDEDGRTTRKLLVEPDGREGADRPAAPGHRAAETIGTDPVGGEGGGRGEENPTGRAPRPRRPLTATEHPDRDNNPAGDKDVNCGPEGIY